MTSINAGGAFYRVQNCINENSERVSASMQRLSSACKMLHRVTGCFFGRGLWAEGGASIG